MNETIEHFGREMKNISYSQHKGQFSLNWRKFPFSSNRKGRQNKLIPAESDIVRGGDWISSYVYIGYWLSHCQDY